MPGHLETRNKCYGEQMSLPWPLIKSEPLGERCFGGGWRRIFMREDKVWERNIFHILEQDTLPLRHHELLLECGTISDPSTEDLGCTGRHSFWQWQYVPSTGFLRKVGKGMGMNTGKIPLETLKKYCSEVFCNRPLFHAVQRKTTRSLHLINCY